MRFVLILLTLICFTGLQSCTNTGEPSRILVFSKTAGFRHNSIPAGIELFKALGKKHNIEVEASEDASVFNEKNLQRFNAVIFLSTTGDILDQYQQADFERFIQAGGGFMGIHAAADTEYDWPWYGKLVGGYFKSHPAGTPTAMIDILDQSHPSTDSLPIRWERTDEWYNYYNLNPDVNVLATLDESTYEGGENGDYHPTAWYHEYDGGRAFYTGGGHTIEAFSEPLFVKHLEGGLMWVLQGSSTLDYQKVNTQRIPEENRFTVDVLDQNLFEPTELEVLDDFRVIFAERRGKIKLYDPAIDSTVVIATLDVHTEHEDGLMGLAVDPNFNENNWVYLYYSPPGIEEKQHLSRFEFKGSSLDLSSEQIILEVPTQRQECCHTGGSIEFDSEGNLYLSTGDDTNPFASGGYAPIDEQKGRKPWDAQRTSGNANDLRGAILRIKVNEDGSYSIPEGNLFPEGTQGTRPEIYVMGNRNPYRISLDSKTGTLYWGEVGPDAQKDSVGYGPMGHDEINQAKEAGFFGWPYFVANNKAYSDYDFVSASSGNPFDASAPVNRSVNNTGIEQLPPAQEAFIWYPYGESDEFPILGSGGRNAMAGPVFYSDEHEDSETKFPDYYNGKLFIYDWMRGWVHVVTMDEDENYVSMEKFMPSHKFSNPMDMQFARDGSLYVLEYGTRWYAQNPDARLIRINFNKGNRPPVIIADVDIPAGATPHRVQFTSEGSEDYDMDELSYLWNFDGENTSTDPNPEFEYQLPGSYTPSLTITDEAGNSVTKEIQIMVGNDPPKLTIDIVGNQTFYWEEGNIEYVVSVDDTEDGSLGSGISEDEVLVTNHYLQVGFDQAEIELGHKTPGKFLEGSRLIKASDCMTCHKVDDSSVGPSYKQVAQKYTVDPNAVTYLAGKIISGGGGVWGERAMAAHPTISQDDAESIASYILSLNEDNIQRLPVSGALKLSDHINDPLKGKYYIKASYMDKGNGEIESIESSKTRTIRYYQVPANEATLVDGSKFESDGFEVVIARNGTKMILPDIDLAQVGSIALNGFSFGLPVTVEAYLDNSLMATGQFNSTGIPGPQEGIFVGSGTINIPETSKVGQLELRVKAPGEGGPAGAFTFLNFNKSESI